jgi:hypothetical protein
MTPKCSLKSSSPRVFDQPNANDTVKCLCCIFINGKINKNIIRRVSIILMPTYKVGMRNSFIDGLGNKMFVLQQTT